MFDKDTAYESEQRMGCNISDSNVVSHCEGLGLPHKKSPGYSQES